MKALVYQMSPFLTTLSPYSDLIVLSRMSYIPTFYQRYSLTLRHKQGYTSHWVFAHKVQAINDRTLIVKSSFGSYLKGHLTLLVILFAIPIFSIH